MLPGTFGCSATGQDAETRRPGLQRQRGWGRKWGKDGCYSLSGVGFRVPQMPSGDVPTPLSLRQDGSLGGEGQATFLAEAGILTSDFPCSPVGEEQAWSQKCRSGRWGEGRAAEAVSGIVGPMSMEGKALWPTRHLQGPRCPVLFSEASLATATFPSQPDLAESQGGWIRER